MLCLLEDYQGITLVTIQASMLRDGIESFVEIMDSAWGLDSSFSFLLL